MQPKTWEFEGEQMTIGQIHALVSRTNSIKVRTLRDRLENGEKTVAQVLRSKPKRVNAGWNNYRFGRGALT